MIGLRSTCNVSLETIGWAVARLNSGITRSKHVEIIVLKVRMYADALIDTDRYARIIRVILCRSFDGELRLTSTHT